MSSKIKAIRGMNDLLPHATKQWRALEKKVSDCLLSYGYQEIRFPLVENTALFKRSIGEVTDIVEKEMYTFEDLNGESLSLRPEGTASCVRASLEHGLLHNQTQKLWYYGPMFRHEKPQKGRYRQFYQFGVEAFGFDGVSIELELLLIAHNIWRQLGIDDTVTLEINSLGKLEERNQHRQALIDYFTRYKQCLDQDSKRRLQSNPLRILDSKYEPLQAIIDEAPRLRDYLGKESEAHFETLCQFLTDFNIDYRINSRLVRGLDYYCDTVFEWTTTQLGAQGTLCAGGRYNGLIEQLGGKPNAAAGFAIGMERLVLMLEQKELDEEQAPETIVMVNRGADANIQCLRLAETIRQHFPQVTVITNCHQASFKSQFKTADKIGADLALVIAESEAETHSLGIKWLKAEKEQINLAQSGVISYLTQHLSKG